LSFLCDFLGYFLCHFFGALYIFLGQVWGERKGELATGRLRADSGQETDSVYFAMIYIGRMGTMTKLKKNGGPPRATELRSPKPEARSLLRWAP
jgi:hypothetical protein